jgi:hypothetical protein
MHASAAANTLWNMRCAIRFANAILLFLSIAIIVLWTWSFRRDMRIPYSYHRRAFEVLIRRGATEVDNDPEIAAQTEKEERARQAVAMVPGAGLLGLIPGGEKFSYPPSQVPPAWSRSSRVVLPAASVLLIVLPVGGVMRWNKTRRRVAAGLCGACGYNLTGNMSGVCPECGIEFSRC